jgi:hypothetical protein
MSITFEFLTAVVKKNSVFCGVTPCSPLKRLHDVMSQRMELFKISINVHILKEISMFIKLTGIISSLISSNIHLFFRL